MALGSARCLPSTALSPIEARAIEELRNLAPLWITGGWVRDKLLECTGVNPVAHNEWRRLRALAGCPPGDVDVLVEGITVREFYERCKKSKTLRSTLLGFPAFVPARGARPLDAVKLRLPQCQVDVTSLVESLGVEAGKHSSGSDAAALLGADAEHRDTTFNACYYNSSTQEVLDPSGRGISDLRAGVVRMPHPEGAAASIREDPVRFLRCLRFAARLGFALDEELSDSGLRGAGHGIAPGRLLYELKKALLLHNRPSRFLELLGDGEDEPHRFFFGGAGDITLRTWQAAVGRVRRLEALVLDGVDRGILTSQSSHWKGRQADGPRAAFLAPDWRKTGVRENDWAELLLAALCWRCDADSLKRVGAQLQLSVAMIENISELQSQARQNLVATQTAAPGAHILKSAVASSESTADFWARWPCR